MDRFPKYGTSASTEAFTGLVQGDITFAQLFIGAKRRQRVLADIGRAAVAQAIDGPHQRNAVRPVSARVVAHTFRSRTGRTLLIDPGRKPRSRAREKLATRYQGQPASALADVVRIMMIPSTPRLGEAVAAALKLRFRHHDTGWRVRPSGHFSRALYIEMEPGYIGEIAFQNAGQYRAGNRSHPLYEIVRVITGPNHHPDLAHVPPVHARKSIAAQCNRALTSAGLEALALFDAADFGPERYWRTYYSLVRIVQDIHERAAARASYAWRELYCDCVSAFNADKAYVDRLRMA